MMMTTPDLDTLNAQQLRALARTLLATVSEKEALLLHKDHDIRFKEVTIAKLTHEIAVLRRYQFGKKVNRLAANRAVYSTKRSPPTLPPSSKSLGN